MIVNGRRSLLEILLVWQWRHTLLFALIPAALAYLYGHTSLPTLLPPASKMPTIPITGIGAAIGFFIGFRANASYARWWEGRQLWGRLINTSRHWGTQAVQLLGAQDREVATRLVYRHIAYVHALRALLRAQDPLADEEVLAALAVSGDDPEGLRAESNLTHALLDRNSAAVVALADAGRLHELRLQQLDESIRHLLDIQGGCERIKKTPLPPIFGLLADRLIMAYAVFFPLVVIPEVGWLSVPLNVMVCMAFMIINEAARVLEDPFTMFFNGLPLSAISRMIEVNLRQRLGESEGLPPMLTPSARGVLM